VLKARAEGKTYKESGIVAGYPAPRLPINVTPTTGKPPADSNGRD